MELDQRSRAANTYTRSTKTYADIAAEFGVSERTILRWAKADNWPEKRRKFLAVGGSGMKPVAVGNERVRVDYHASAIAALARIDEVISTAQPTSLEGLLRAKLAYLEFMRKRDPMDAEELVLIAEENGITMKTLVDWLQTLRDQNAS